MSIYPALCHETPGRPREGSALRPGRSPVRRPTSHILSRAYFRAVYNFFFNMSFAKFLAVYTLHRFTNESLASRRANGRCGTSNEARASTENCSMSCRILSLSSCTGQVRHFQLLFYVITFDAWCIFVWKGGNGQCTDGGCWLNFLAILVGHGEARQPNFGSSHSEPRNWTARTIDIPALLS